jgi:hypothetical protein
LLSYTEKLIIQIPKPVPEQEETNQTVIEPASTTEKTVPVTILKEKL